jgi:vacuolar-type H+-ATPase subunit E/Vma4
VEAIRREAEERIAALRAEQEAAAEQHRADVLRRKEVELRAALAGDLAGARAAGQRRVLESRDALLGRVFTAARALLPEALERPAARERLIERAREALGFVPPGPAVIACSQGVAAVLEGRLDARTDLSVETRDDVAAGFRITGADGALVVDATLERLLELERPALSIEVLDRLEGKGE